MIKLPTYHHPYRGTVPFHQSVHPSLRRGASRRGKPLRGSAPLEGQPTPVTAWSAPAQRGRPVSGIAHFVPAPTPVSSSVFSQQHAEKMYRERLWLLHFHQSLLDTRSSRRALEVTYAGFRTRKFRQCECFFAATRRKNVSRTLVVTAFSPNTSRYTLLTSRTRGDVRRLPDKKISSVRVVFRSNAQEKSIGNRTRTMHLAPNNK